MNTPCYTVIARFNGSTPRHYEYMTLEGATRMQHDPRYEVLDIERQQYTMEAVASEMAALASLD